MDKLQHDILDIRVLMENKTAKDMMPILQAYKQALDDIRASLFNITSKYIGDNGVFKPSDAQRYSILKSLEIQIATQAKKVGYIEIDVTNKILTDTYSESYYQTQYVLEKALPVVAASFVLLNPSLVATAVNTPLDSKLWSDRIWSNKDLLSNSLRTALNKHMIQGTDVRKLAKAVKDEFEVSSYNAKRLVYTESARVTTTAQVEIYNNSGVVDQLLFDATLDGKTSPFCREHDGQIYDINSDHPTVPAHPLCRSALLPIVAGYVPTRKRENVKTDSGTKPIIDYSTYDNWAKTRNIT